MWSRVLCPQWLLSGGRLLAEVWRDCLRVEQITGFGCLVCEHHRSVPVASLGEFSGFSGWRDAWCRGEGASPFSSFLGVGGGGVDVDSQVSGLGQDVACLDRICPFLSPVPGKGALWRVLGLGKGETGS